MENYKVYMHTAPNGKVYIGITKQKLKRRWQNGSGYNKNSHFKRAIKKYGWDNFKHELLFENLSEEEAKRKEIELIAFYKSNDRKYGYNNSTGGESASGKVLSEETKSKIRKANLGKKLPKETREKISKSNMGRKLSKEQIEIISRTHKGKKVSEETRKLISINTKKAMNNKEVKEKISKSSRGRKASEETKMKMSLKRKGKPLKKINLIAINPKTLNIVKNFSSVIEALAWLKQNGINNPYCSNLYRCINGERKTAYNFIWKVI